MCLCNGSGGINKQHSWGIEFIPCPDTDCTFDKVAHRENYNRWKQRVIDKLGNIFEGDNNEQNKENKVSAL